MATKRVRVREKETRSNVQRVEVKYCLQEAIEVFIQAKKVEGRSKRTISDYVKNLGYFQKWLEETSVDQSDIRSVDVNVFRSYVAHMSERYAPKTTNTRLVTLKTMFRFLTDEDILSNNPLEKIKMLKEPRDTVTAYTEEEINRLLAQPDKRTFVGFRDYILMILMLDCGVRINEIQSLKKQHVDFVYRQITITGQNSKNRCARIIPFSKQTAKLLIELINETATHFETDYVFVTYEGEPISYTGIYSNFQRYGELAGFTDSHIRFHKFRHTFAKMFILNGGDPFTLQRLLGHNTMDMTRRYVQLNTEDLRHQHGQFSPIASLLGGKRKLR